MEGCLPTETAPYIPVPLQPEEQESLGSFPIISQYATQHNLHPDQSLQNHTGIVANIGIHTLTDH
ncbi:hypothetical protein Bca4012_091180 [Brassica carinata]